MVVLIDVTPSVFELHVLIIAFERLFSVVVLVVPSTTQVIIAGRVALHCFVKKPWVWNIPKEGMLL